MPFVIRWQFSGLFCVTAGTENADEARDFDLPQKQRFFIQILPPDQAAKRAKDAAEAIVGVKTLIDNKAWPYVQNGLRDYAGSLRYDLNTVIGSKSKEEKRALKAITAELYESLDKVGFAIAVLHIYLSSFPCFSIFAVQAEIPNILN